MRLHEILAESQKTIKIPVSQKPRQGPLRTQTGAGAHQDKKKAQKQGKEKHKGQEVVDEGYLHNAGQEDSPVANAITRRILLQRTDLLSKYGPEKVGAAIDEVADFVGNVDEIGSSDVSGWVKHVEQMLGNMMSESDANAIFDEFENLVESQGLDESIYDTVTDEDILRETAAWRRKEGKSKTGGLNKKGVASYRREHPGSKLQTAVTTKPSKLKKGSKAAKRRKSFCARMSGVKGPMKKPNGEPTRKALALRKWNC